MRPDQFPGEPQAGPRTVFGMELIVTDAEAVARTVADLLALGHQVAVVALGDPGSTPPALPDGVVEHLVIEAVDTVMPAGDWIHRFGGSASDLFDAADADELIEFAVRHANEWIVFHCGQGVARSSAAAAVCAAAVDGRSLDVALVVAQAAQERGFAWRDRRGFQPNERILEVGFVRLAERNAGA